MKNAALFNGPLVVPSSVTRGTDSGMGVESTYGFAACAGSWNTVLIVDGGADGAVEAVGNGGGGL